jgi:hypothetical protein
VPDATGAGTNSRTPPVASLLTQRPTGAVFGDVTRFNANSACTETFCLTDFRVRTLAGSLPLPPSQVSHL